MTCDPWCTWVYREGERDSLILELDFSIIDISGDISGITLVDISGKLLIKVTLCVGIIDALGGKREAKLSPGRRKGRQSCNQ